MMHTVLSGNKTISGLFDSPYSIQELLTRLDAHGVTRDHINMLMSDHTKKSFVQLQENNKLPEGATTGAVTGGVLGAIIGGLTLLGSLSVPGLGLLAAGPIVGALTGGAIGTAAGGVLGSLVGMGIPEHEAKVYADELQRENQVLVFAQVPDNQADDVRKLFEQFGGRQVHKH